MRSEIEIWSSFKWEMILYGFSNCNFYRASIITWVALEHMLILLSVGSHKFQTSRIEFHSTERIRDCGYFKREIALNSLHCRKLFYLILFLKILEELFFEGRPREHKEATTSSKLIWILYVVRVVIIYTDTRSFIASGSLLSLWFYIFFVLF